MHFVLLRLLLGLAGLSRALGRARDIKPWSFALVLVLGACTIIPTEQAGSPAPTGAGSYPTVEAAMRVLIERHVDRPSSKTLLLGATETLTAFIKQRGGTAPDEPRFSGDTTADLGRFAAYADKAKTATTITSGEFESLAVAGMARALNECHTYYLDAERAKNFNAPGGQRYGGIGAVISQPAPNTDQLPEITVVFPETPAERAGLKAGDRIKKVNDRDVAGLTAEEVANMIRGPEGTPVSLLVVRGSTERAFTLTRGTIQPPTVFNHGVTNGIGRVSVPQVVGNAPRELFAALEELERQGAKAWIIDLRGNPGGDLTAAQLIASTFVKSGVIVYQTDRDGRQEPLRVNEKAYYPRPKPLAILVNRGSASGSEIIASAAQEHKVGRVFGLPTAGCVGIAQPRELPDGGLLLVTTAQMQSGVSKQDLNGKGVTPDEIVQVSEDDATDKILDAAVAWLKTQVR